MILYPNETTMTHRVRIFAGGLLTMAAAACSDSWIDPGPPANPITYAVSPARQWSGGTMTLRSSRANAGHSSRLVLAGEDSVLATAVDDTTYTFSLPTGPSGSMAIRVTRSGGAVDSAGTVDRVGFATTEDMPSPYWSFSAWRPGGHPAILGTAFASQDLASFDLVTGIVTDYPGIKSGGEFTYPVSVTEYETSVTTAAGADTVAVTQLYPTVVSRFTFSPIGLPRQAVALSDSLYIATSHHSAYIRSLDNSRLVWSGGLEEPFKTILSPDSRLVIVTGSTGTDAPYGVPVFDARSGESLFVAPVRHVGGAVFSPDGSVLYVVGGQYPEFDTLRVVSTATGATIGTAVLPDTAMGLGLSLDAQSGTLYVSAQLAGTGEVLVFDATTLTHRGTLPTGVNCGQFCEATTLLDAPAHRLYMAGPTLSTGAPSAKVFIFDLLP